MPTVQIPLPLQTPLQKQSPLSTIKPFKENHTKIKPIKENHTTIKPIRVNHTTIQPTRENPIKIKSLRENGVKIKPKRTERCAAIITTSDVLCLMDSLHLPVTTDIYVSLIKECTENRDQNLAADLHAHINRSNLRPTLPLLNRIMLMYVSCGCLDIAHNMFDRMRNRDFNSWAIIIAGYVDIDEYQEALYLFSDMLQRRKLEIYTMDFTTLAWILVWIFKSCVETMNYDLGTQLHGWMLKLGYASNLHLGSSLINFYGKSNCPITANSIFDQMPRHDTVSWTAKIVVNCKLERFHEVFNIFNEMGKSRIKKNQFTFSSVIKACGRLKNDDKKCGLQVHADAIKHGIESSLFVRCGLVDMYGKCGQIKDAVRVFEMIGEDERNEACWNAMLSGYIQNGLGIEALMLLYSMRRLGVQPQESLLNEVRIVCGGCMY